MCLKNGYRMAKKKAVKKVAKKVTKKAAPPKSSALNGKKKIKEVPCPADLPENPGKRKPVHEFDETHQS